MHGLKTKAIIAKERQRRKDAKARYAAVAAQTNVVQLLVEGRARFLALGGDRLFRIMHDAFERGMPERYVAKQIDLADFPRQVLQDTRFQDWYRWGKTLMLDGSIKAIKLFDVIMDLAPTDLFTAPLEPGRIKNENVLGGIKKDWKSGRVLIYAAATDEAKLEWYLAVNLLLEHGLLEQVYDLTSPWRTKVKPAPSAPAAQVALRRSMPYQHTKHRRVRQYRTDTMTWEGKPVKLNGYRADLTSGVDVNERLPRRSFPGKNYITRHAWDKEKFGT